MRACLKCLPLRADSGWNCERDPRPAQGLHLSQLVRSAGDFQQVKSELSLHGPMDNADLIVEYDLIKFRHHHAGAKRAQITALTTGGATREFARNVGKIGTVDDFLFKFSTFFYAVDEDMSC